VEGRRLGTGSLAEMGPGTMPMALGALLVLLGLLSMRSDPDAQDAPAMIRPQWRGWGCIILGVASFILLGPRAGLVPATFACVFISALGDRTATLKGAVILSAGVTVFGIVLFHYLLRINIPLIGGRV
jgi:hypothetical protein